MHFKYLLSFKKFVSEKLCLKAGKQLQLLRHPHFYTIRFYLNEQILVPLTHRKMKESYLIGNDNSL